ncbi:MAG: PQQ-binding-like beta-propeller repeat protein [Planctomycetales bacterium]|nr:PQQ-binding-like beta-propeller repeat protein [Planctomycetales bacterium]
MSRLVQRRRVVVAMCALAAVTLDLPAAAAPPLPIPAERLSSLAPPRVETAPSAVRRQLVRLDWLVEHEQWDTAATLVLQLAAADPTELLPAGESSDMPVAAKLEQIVAAMPPAGATTYNQLASLTAAPRLEAATADRDVAALARIAEQFPGAVAAWRALWRHGGLALERADWRTATADWARVAAGLQTAPPEQREQLAKDGITPAAASARLIVAAIRGGQFSTAAQRLDAPAEAGLTDDQRSRLSRLLAESYDWPPPRPATGDWPQFGGDSLRSNHLAHVSGAPEYAAAWTAPLEADDYAEDSEVAQTIARLNFAAPPLVFPVASGELIGWQDAAGLHVRQLADGTPSTHSDGPAYKWPTESHPHSGRGGQLSIKLPAHLATIDKATLLAATPGDLAPRQESKTAALLVGVEFGAGLRLRLRAAGDPRDALAGPPIVGERVVAMAVCRASGTSLRTGLVGFDRNTGAEVWRTWLGTADTPAAGQAYEYPQAGVAAVEGVAFVTTNLGMTAAVRIADGRPLWLRTYPRALVRDEYGGVRYYAAFPQTPLIAGDLLIAAPLDADRVFAWHAMTGELKWATPLPAANARMWAVDETRVLMAGERPWALDAATGEVDPQWGENLWGGAGQGAVAGDWLLWPTDGSVRIVDRRTCETVGEPLDLPTGGGANVFAVHAGEFVVAAGRNRLIVYRQVAPPAATNDSELPVDDSSPSSPEQSP